MGGNDVLAAATSWRAPPGDDVPQVALHLLPIDLILTKPEQGETEKNQDELSPQKTEDSD